MAENDKKQNTLEEQKLLKEMHDQAMAKLKEAIELNKVSNRSKESLKAKADACSLILVAIRAGVKFDPNDPSFQIFVKKQSWRDAMGLICKKACDFSTSLGRNVLELLKLIPSIAGFNVGKITETLTNLFKKNAVNPLEEDEVYNRSLWSDFYDEIPKGNGNGPACFRGSRPSKVPQLNKSVSSNTLQQRLSRGTTNDQRLTPMISDLQHEE